MVYRRRKPARSLIFHSDRGVQYAAARAYRERLEAYGIRQSMSRRGDPYDNAVAENFFSCSSVSWSTSSTILQGQLRRTTYLSISKPFTTPSAPILPSAGFRLQVLKLNLPLPPPDGSTPYLRVFIQLFYLVFCPFLGEGLTLPGTKPFRQIPPGNACIQPVYHCIEHFPVAFAWPPSLRLSFWWKQIFHSFPLRFTQLMSFHVLSLLHWRFAHKCWVLKQALGPYSNKRSRPVFRGGSFCEHSVKEKREEKNQRFVWTCRIFASRSRACSRGG